MTLIRLSDWNDFLSQHPQAHLLQTGAWGELKQPFGWQPERVRAGESGAQVLFRRLPLGLTIAYIPRGPVGGDWAALWPEVDALCRRKNAIFLKIEPDAWEGDSTLVSRLPHGAIPAAPIQPRRTVLVDLQGTEEEILARMKQKTRYNIHLAARKDVEVRVSDDLDAFYALMQTTGERDGFGVHSKAYYERAYRLFAPEGTGLILQAEYAGQPLAALMLFMRGERAWYLYGASNDLERNRMPAYRLQWEAMRLAREHGCRTYDLWGVPDEDEDTLEAQFTARSDGLWGVYRFKRGFGGTLMRSAGAWDRIYQPVLYRVYRWLLRRRAPAGGVI